MQTVSHRSFAVHLSDIFRKPARLGRHALDNIFWLTRILIAQPAKEIEAKASTPRIGYIKRGPFSYINLRVSEALQHAFPEYKLHVIDVVNDILGQQKSVIFINLIHVLRSYGWELATGRKSLKGCFYRTPYMFRQIKRLTTQYIRNQSWDYVFTFQTQSLYDAAVEGIPHFVYTDHTHLTNLYYPGFTAEQLYSKDWIDLERDIYRNATKTFVMSTHVRRSMLEQYACDANRVRCIYAGANLNGTLPLPENDHYSNCRIIFIGIEWERKGGPQLVEAFKLVLQRLPKARLVIVGCDPALDHPNIEVVGRVSLETVRQYLLQSSVFCLPTTVEPFGIVSVEAYLHRIPVVASRIGAIPELIEDHVNGRLVEPGDVPALADALLDLLQDPEKCRRFGEAGYHRVKDQYTWTAVGKRLKDEIGAALPGAAS